MSENLRELLSDNDRKILFVGIGNALKQDDGIGVYISNRIKKTDNIEALTVEVSIENYIGKINTLNPDILILIDCVDLGTTPGKFSLLLTNQLQDMTFTTHNISLTRISEFFRMPVFLLGIQPEKVDFGENISYLVQTAGDKIVQLINRQEVNYGN